MKSLIEILAGILMMAIICHSSNAVKGKLQPTNLAGNFREGLGEKDQPDQLTFNLRNKPTTDNCYCPKYNRTVVEREISESTTEKECIDECNGNTFCSSWSFSVTENRCFLLEFSDEYQIFGFENGPDFQMNDCLTEYSDKFSAIGSIGTGKMEEVHTEKKIYGSNYGSYCSELCKRDKYCYRWVYARSWLTGKKCTLYNLARVEDSSFRSGIKTFTKEPTPDKCTLTKYSRSVEQNKYNVEGNKYKLRLKKCIAQCNAADNCISWSSSRKHCLLLEFTDHLRCGYSSGPDFQIKDCLTSGFSDKISNIGSTGSGKMKELKYENQDKTSTSCSEACESDEFCYRWRSSIHGCYMFKLARDQDDKNAKFQSGVKSF